MGIEGLIPSPLHPAVVHFPIVLMFLVPLAMLLALRAIRRGVPVRRAWWPPVAACAALSLAAWVAVQTGENEEERVERVVAEAALEAHEEPAERFLLLSGVVTVLAAGGLVGGTAGRAVRIVSVAAGTLLLAAGVQVGHSGGELAYRHGAAAAYSVPAQPGDTPHRTAAVRGPIVGEMEETERR